jgi:hypothetical protein
MTTDNAPNDFWFACWSYRSPDGAERITAHCDTRVALIATLAVLNELADAAEPMVSEKPATTRDYVDLGEARKRALRVLEAAS